MSAAAAMRLTQLPGAQATPGAEPKDWNAAQQLATAGGARTTRPLLRIRWSIGSAVVPVACPIGR
jgi:hypothetical protein